MSKPMSIEEDITGPEKTIGRTRADLPPPAIDPQELPAEPPAQRDTPGLSYDESEVPPIFAPTSAPSRERRRLPKLKREQAGVGKWLAAIVDLLDEANAKLDRLLAGQQVDRVGFIRAGIGQYDQAMSATAAETRVSLLIGAVQSLNEGREQVLRNLEAVLQGGQRDAEWTDHAWKLIGIDKQGVDLRRHLLENELLIAESLYYLNVATAYAFKAYVELGEPQSAEVAVRQFSEAFGVIQKGVFDRAKYMPATPVVEGILDVEDNYVDANARALMAVRAPVR